MINFHNATEKMSEISLIQKTCGFYKYIHEDLKHFPKSDRYGIGSKIENLTLELLGSWITANSEIAQFRIKTLNQVNPKLNFLKLLIRLCWELKIINQKKYLDRQENLQEIGRMLGGWIKSTKKELGLD